jgi:hypothetical protein
MTASRSIAGKPRSHRTVAICRSVAAREYGLTDSEISGQGRRKFPSRCGGLHELVRSEIHG